MATQTRIKQRFDQLSNWIQNDTVLLRGELAVVDCGNQTRFKLGDGTKRFTQLPFVDQSLLCTDWAAAGEITQGTQASAAKYGFAAGAFLCANANYSQALGYNSQTLSSDKYSFVWNGDDTRVLYDYYTSHGKGTFSINPLSGAAGVFIGEDTLSSLLEDASEAAVPAIFRTIQLVKPQQPEGHRLHFRCDIARDDQFEDLIVEDFDSAEQERWQFLKRFVSDGLSGVWETMVSSGFYTDADDIPVSFSFADALSSLGETPKISSQYFMRYIWYYELSGTEHKSDEFSIAVPSNTGVGANPGDVVHKSEFYDLEQTVQPLKETIGKDADYDQYYVCKPMVVADISTSLEGEFDILLEDYEASQIYRFQFTVGSSAAYPKFYVDYGNGPELDSSLKVNSDSYVFKAGSSYYAELQGDVLKVDTIGYSGSSSGPYRYPLVTAELTSASGSLCCLVEDHTVTTIEVSSATTPLIIKLPPKPSDGGARDFILRIEVSSSTAPGVTFTGLDESITFDSDADDWMTIEPGLNLISFTETK